MLNVTAQRNAAGAKAYFARSDYYARADEQEIVGEWGGRGAVLLGLFGQVDKPSFESLCDNLHPKTGEPLTKITRDNRRVGYDFTWSAPKSVSVMHALTGDASIMDAWRETVRETMDQMESEMQTRVRKSGQEKDRTTGNWVWSEFTHLTSRPVKNIPCPQLHTHCFVQNLTFDLSEEQWKAGQFGKIKGDGYYWQAVQQARFAVRLEELGFETRRTKDAFEIVGVPDSVLEKFSQRTSVIKRLAAKLGITDPKRMAGLAATTREAKNDTIPYDQLVELWESWLTKEEASAVAIVAQEKQPKELALDNAAHARFAVEHTFERSSVADERRLLTTALRHGCGEVTPEGIQADVDRHGLLKREEGGKVWVTTKDVLAEEAKMLHFAVSGKASCQPLANAGEIHFRDKRLNDGQRAAVEHVMTTADRIALIAGRAGVGKTELTKEAVAQIEDRGKPVAMIAPGTNQVEDLQKKDGFSNARTLASFLLDTRAQNAVQGGYIWLEESGIVGTRSMAELFAIADRVQARVVISGDTRQLSSVERGSAMRVLETIAGLKPAEVTEIQRQKDTRYKEAVRLISEGEVLEGYETLDAMGCIKKLPVWDSYEPVAKDYADKWDRAADGEKERAVLIVCPTHAEGQKINNAVRAELKARGVLASEDQQCKRLTSLQWTEAQRGDLANYSGEEVVQFHHNTGSFKVGQRVRASDVLDRLKDAKPKHFNVFTESTIDLAAGDTIRMNGIGKTLDGRHKLSNGAVYRIAKFTRDGNLVLSNGWKIDRDLGQIAHGYVNTGQAAQGRTVEHAILVQSATSRPASSQEGFYVAVSRGKRSVTVYTDDKHDLIDAVRRSSQRMSATELAAKPKPPIWQRMRDAMAKTQMVAMVAAKKTAWELEQMGSIRRKEPDHAIAR